MTNQEFTDFAQSKRWRLDWEGTGRERVPIAVSRKVWNGQKDHIYCGFNGDVLGVAIRRKSEKGIIRAIAKLEAFGAKLRQRGFCEANFTISLDKVYLASVYLKIVKSRSGFGAQTGKI